MTDVALEEPLGTHVLELEIADVIDETADARSLVFKSIPDAPITPEKLRYAPGQFLTLRVPSALTGSVARCYSLCGSPHTGDPLTVTVKRTRGGYASNWLCDNAHAGMRIHALAPSGTFVPETLDTDFLLLAAGSGITPMMAILKSALSQGGGRVTLIYANRDEDSVIFAATLRELAATHPDRFTAIHWLESVQGLPTTSGLTDLVAAFGHRETFICGPGAFMATAREAMARSETAPGRIHVEVFKSLESDPFARVTLDVDGWADSDEVPATAHVILDGQSHELSWPRRAKLLDVLLNKGLDAPFSCREGHCGACAVLKKSGEVEMELNDVLEPSDLEEGLILACQAHPISDSVEVTYDE